jgi:sterol desaturase/sphingolipid hydroxylase (fatty acid hydroxylase superfamily)
MGLGDIRWLSAVAIVVGAAIIITLERLFPYDKGQKFFREGWFYDFFLYTIAQSYALGMVISFIIEFIDTHTGLSRLRLVSDWPIWLQLLFFLVTHDFYICLQHTHPLFWRIHEAHHSAQSVDWLSGSRSHALEILINQTVEFAPIVLLGAPPEVAVLKGTIDALWGMYIHSNIDVRSGWLRAQRRAQLLCPLVERSVQARNGVAVLRAHQSRNRERKHQHLFALDDG